MARKSYTRSSIWRTQLGEHVRIRDMSDIHVANLLHFLKRYVPKHRLIPTVKKEARLRGLTDKFLKLAPIPYQDTKGIWRVWSYEAGTTVPLSKKPVRRKRVE